MTATPPPPAPSATGATPPRTRSIDRRSFLFAGAMAAVAAACSGADDSAPPTSGQAGADTTTGGERSTTPSTDTTDVGDEGGSLTTTSTPATSTQTNELTAADFDALPVCRTLPESTAGPFPLDEQLLRADITEGYPGHPLRLGLRVVDADCVPVTDVAVEIWHTDASGDYSAFVDDGTGKDEGPGTTFLRGTQPVNGEGIAEFVTIYPGWYPGRTPHIHFRVRAGDEAVFTSQLYFPDDYSAAIYADGAYAEFGPAETTNAEDGIAGDPAADGTLLTVTPSPTGGSSALANLGIGSA